SNVNRREDQLDQLCNVILLKLENDKRGRARPQEELFFAPRASDALTAKHLREKFKTFTGVYPDIFTRASDRELRFSDHTLHECADELAKYNLIDVSADTVSVAFQVLRSAALKQEEGQYFTPRPVIEAAVRLMQLDWDDIVLDLACGTGGFLIQCLLEMKSRFPKKGDDISRWAQTHLFGIDKDSIAIKLTKSVMQILGDGSAHCVRGDSVLTHTWGSEYPHLLSNHFANERFSVILTNPPFGAPLTISYEQAKKSSLSIVDAQGHGKDIELGLAMLNRCHQLLKPDGYLCIVLPETYFFSSSYAFVREWCGPRLRPVGVVNVPMEAFQGFCRAKTNLYVFRKLRSHV
ncbi:MAG: HsdM family class I SAM-dependent methyltransferase, partial [Candidatus Acidiferrales bacterium]